MDIAFVIIITSGIILAQDFLFVNIEIKNIKVYFKVVRISFYSNIHILCFYARSCPWSQPPNPMALPLVVLGYCHWQAKQATKKAEL